MYFIGTSFNSCLYSLWFAARLSLPSPFSFPPLHLWFNSVGFQAAEILAKEGISAEVNLYWSQRNLVRTLAIETLLTICFITGHKFAVNSSSGQEHHQCFGQENQQAGNSWRRVSSAWCWCWNLVCLFTLIYVPCWVIFRHFLYLTLCTS